MKVTRAASIPLVTHDPYFSIWSSSDNLYDGKWRYICKQNDDKFRQHEPCNLGKGHREWQVDIIDGIQYLFHVPDTCITSDFLHL